MTARVVLHSLIPAVFAIGLLTVAAPAWGEEIGVALLLPPGAQSTYEEEEAFSKLKRALRDEGYDLLGVGEYNPEQANMPIVEKGHTTGVVTHEAGDADIAEKLREQLAASYPDIIAEQRDKKNSPFPEGSLGVLLPGVVLPKDDKEEPPPWDISFRDLQVEVDGGMNPKGVEGVFRETSAELFRCWPKAVGQDKRMEGRVKVRITVDGGGEGIISNIEEADDPDASWVDCVSEVYLAWAYPASPDGRSSKVFIDVRFALDEVPAAPVEEPETSEETPADETEATTDEPEESTD